MIYFGRYLESQCCKVGFSNRPERRRKQIEWQKGQEFDYFETREGDLALENTIHAALEPHRINGEWYIDHPEVLLAFRTLEVPETRYDIDQIRLRLADRKLPLVATEVGVSKQTLYTFMKDLNSRPKMTTLKALSEYLEANP